MSVEYIRCPFCARRWHIYSDNYDGGVFRWGPLTIPPSEFPLIVTYEMESGPGRGHKIKGEGGSHLVAEYNIMDMINSDDPVHVELMEQMLDRFRRIFNDLISTGVFDISEFL